MKNLRKRMLFVHSNSFFSTFFYCFWFLQPLNNVHIMYIISMIDKVKVQWPQSNEWREKQMFNTHVPTYLATYLFRFHLHLFKVFFYYLFSPIVPCIDVCSVQCGMYIMAHLGWINKLCGVFLFFLFIFSCVAIKFVLRHYSMGS